MGDVSVLLTKSCRLANIFEITVFRAYMEMDFPDSTGSFGSEQSVSNNEIQILLLVIFVRLLRDKKEPTILKAYVIPFDKNIDVTSIGTVSVYVELDDVKDIVKKHVKSRKKANMRNFLEYRINEPLTFYSFSEFMAFTKILSESWDVAMLEIARCIFLINSSHSCI
jgi:hypothetical protein